MTRRPLGSFRRRAARAALAAAALSAAVLAVGACSSSDDSSTSRSSTSVTTTSAPTPSTVDDADFDAQATTAELMIRNAGTDPCKVAQAFGPASSLPTPVNATQTERGVRVVAALFESAAASAPEGAAGDAPVLRKAAADLIAEGEAAEWTPNWLMQTPEAIASTEVTQAYSSYQAAAAAVCGTTTSVP
mgnify:CR=1 FL=1